WAEILGHELNEIDATADFFESQVHPDDLQNALIRWNEHATGESTLYECRFRMKTKAGDWIWVLDRGRVVEWAEDGKAVRASGTHLDITDQMESEKLREQYRKELEIYSSILRHDLSNDLMIVQGHIEALRMMCDEDDSDTVRMLDTADAVAIRMGNLLKAISTPQDTVETYIVPLIERIASEAKEATDGLTIKIKVGTSTKDIEVVGGRLLPAVFDNIIRNSATYGGKKVNVKIAIRRKDGFIEIQFTDDGPGIASEIKDRLFQRGATTRDEGGGYGLYLTKQILETLGGSIQLVETPKKNGASFLITLPIVT
ncbi:MAG: PAS domain-containing sensor histidine kinase, partial [Candidatus Thorarchaeota archaeon]